MAVLIVTNVEWRRTVYSALDAFDIRTIRAGSLDEAVRQGKIRDNDIVVLNACGGGLTWGASVVRW